MSTPDRTTSPDHTNPGRRPTPEAYVRAPSADRELHRRGRGAPYETERSDKAAGTVELAPEARGFTVLVECWKQIGLESSGDSYPMAKGSNVGRLSRVAQLRGAALPSPRSTRRYPLPCLEPAPEQFVNGIPKTQPLPEEVRVNRPAAATTQRPAQRFPTVGVSMSLTGTASRPDGEAHYGWPRLAHSTPAG